MATGLHVSFGVILAEKTLDYCSCQQNYNYTTANGTTFHSQGGCIQDNPNIPPWCLVVEKSCSQPPPKKPDGQSWDICRGEHPCALGRHTSSPELQREGPLTARRHGIPLSKRRPSGEDKV